MQDARWPTADAIREILRPMVEAFDIDPDRVESLTLYLDEGSPRINEIRYREVGGPDGEGRMIQCHVDYRPPRGEPTRKPVPILDDDGRPIFRDDPDESPWGTGWRDRPSLL